MSNLNIVILSTRRILQLADLLRNKIILASYYFARNGKGSSSYIFPVLLFISLPSFSQEIQPAFTFHCTYDDQPLALGEKYPDANHGDSLQIETLRFYISNVQLFQGEKHISSLNKKHWLIDLANPATCVIPYSVGSTFDKIIFKIGIDSLANVSGAMGGDLDPTTGMYWSWQSGYINVKLEGKADHCPARNNTFQFHMGGYQPPYPNIQTVELAILDSKEITIEIALDEFLDQVNVVETYQVMSPSEKAVELAKVFAGIFSVKK